MNKEEHYIFQSEILMSSKKNSSSTIDKQAMVLRLQKNVGVCHGGISMVQSYRAKNGGTFS